MAKNNIPIQLYCGGEHALFCRPEWTEEEAYDFMQAWGSEVEDYIEHALAKHLVSIQNPFAAALKRAMDDVEALARSFRAPSNVTSE